MKTKIVRYKIDTTIDISEHTTVKEVDIPMNGFIREIAVIVPALTGAAATVTLAVTDVDDLALFTQAAIAEGGTTVYQTLNSVNMKLPVAGVTSFKITASETQTTTDKAVYVVVWLEQS